MKNNFNTLRRYIYEYSHKEYVKKTLNGLFRAILEPVVSNQKFESCILLRLKDIDEKNSIMQRLNFSGARVYSFNENLKEFSLPDSQKNKTIWGETEFVIVVGQRYSAALIWDYSETYNQDSSDACVLFNSKIISDISKTILENSLEDFSELIAKYLPDRRENLILNSAINSIAKILDDYNQEIMFQEAEKSHLQSNDDVYRTAENVAEKSKYIAHEIKNNLSVINLYSKIIDKRFENIKATNEELESISNAIKNITNASENVSNLINDLRCLSTPYYTELSIKHLIENIVLQCREKANNEGVNIIIENVQDYIITTDKTKVQCALMNLIYNAIDACDNKCQIKINCIKDEYTLRIVVANNGKKIPSDIVDKIFLEDFTTKEKGNGLGLAICKTQLQHIKSDIELLSSTEDETIFQIVLPLNNMI